MRTENVTVPGGLLRIALIGGGQNSEHDVSLASAASVRAALGVEKYDVLALTIAADGLWFRELNGAAVPLGPTPARALAAAVALIADCDVVFPVLHGPHGEDGTLAALLDLAGKPYVGAGLRGGALAMDKWVTKLIAADLGLGVAPGMMVTTAASAAGMAPARFPVVVKPVAAGSSHGVAVARAAEDLPGAVAEAFRHDDRVLVEDFVVGREIDIAVLERADGTLVVGPPLEIVVDDGAVFDTEQKYGGTARFLIPAPVEDTELKELREAALALFVALGCRGVARFDFFLTADGLVLNEVNTMPGMTAESQVPKMFAAVGLGYSALLDELVRGAMAGFCFSAGVGAGAGPDGWRCGAAEWRAGGVKGQWAGWWIGGPAGPRRSPGPARRFRPPTCPMWPGAPLFR